MDSVTFLTFESLLDLVYLCFVVLHTFKGFDPFEQGKELMDLLLPLELFVSENNLDFLD